MLSAVVYKIRQVVTMGADVGVPVVAVHTALFGLLDCPYTGVVIVPVITDPAAADSFQGLVVQGLLLFRGYPPPRWIFFSSLMVCSSLIYIAPSRNIILAERRAAVNRFVPNRQNHDSNCTFEKVFAGCGCFTSPPGSSVSQPPE